MPRNGSGTMSIPNADFTPGTAISSADVDENNADIAAEITNSLALDGQSVMTGQFKSASGTVSAPGVSFSSDLDCGLYRIGANNIGLALNGAKVVDFLTTGVAITGTFGFSGDFAVNTDKFTVAGASGNTLVAGTLSVTGDLAVNTNKFTVTASNGNTLVAGTLAVTGAVTLSSTLAAGATTITGALSASGDFAIATNKMTVASASGNTAIAGTLAVTGATTLTGALSANNAAGVTAKNTMKAGVYFITDGSANITIQGNAFNVTGVATATVNSQNGFRVTFTNALGGNYIVTASAHDGAVQNFTVITHTRGVTTFDFFVVKAASGVVRNNLIVDLTFHEIN